MSYIADENSFLKRAHDTRNTDETRAFYNRWAETYDADLIEENDYVQPRRCAEMLSRYSAGPPGRNPRYRLRHRAVRRRSV